MAEAGDGRRAGQRPPVELHMDRPHPARVYDALLGGSTNYPADREAAKKTLALLPSAALTARHNRAFMHRAVRYLVEEAGICQFLDIGSGIPTSPNLHEVAQEIAPASRVVYVDNDRIVLTHSRNLHTSHPQGRTAYIQADLCDPISILKAPALQRTLDLSRPIALTLLAVLHWLPAGHDTYAIVNRLVQELPSGSYLALSHATNDIEPEAMARIAAVFRASGATLRARSRHEVLRFFDRLELVEPGLTAVQSWRPDHVDIRADAFGAHEIPLYGAVARKP
ncbi:SAM-dependent methyltransferase [Streptomyces malaysiensis]|nr:SAM-dependent methyltransferase [Streptomyces malaysiensis]